MKSIVNKGFVIAILSTMPFGIAEGVGFGIKAGLNIANVQSARSGISYARIRFCGGGFFALDLGDVFVIQPEVLYTQKGVKWHTISWFFESSHETYGLDYIEMPLLFKLVLPIKGGVKPNLFLGPYFAINVNAKYRIVTDLTSEELDYGEYIKDADYGFVLGGGVDFLLKKGKIVLDGRYTLGWITTLEDGRDQKNKVVSFMLGYSF
jgi:hypothetical protein